MPASAVNLETELRADLKAGRKYAVMRIWRKDFVDFLNF